MSFLTGTSTHTSYTWDLPSPEIVAQQVVIFILLAALVNYYLFAFQFSHIKRACI